MSQEIRLATRPVGVPDASNPKMAEVTREPLEDQQLPVRNRFMSVDPYVRGRMDDWKLCVLPLEIGQVLDGGAVAEVMESRSAENVGKMVVQLAS
jgi:NADPH-dependent curcumin reductase CurA